MTEYVGTCYCGNGMQRTDKDEATCYCGNTIKLRPVKP